MDVGRQTLVYWNERRLWRGWDYVGSYLDRPGPEIYERECIVVPEIRWLADPRIRAVCDDAMDIKRSVQTRTDDNLRHVFG